MPSPLKTSRRPCRLIRSVARTRLSEAAASLSDVHRQAPPGPIDVSVIDSSLPLLPPTIPASLKDLTHHTATSPGNHLVPLSPNLSLPDLPNLTQPATYPSTVSLTAFHRHFHYRPTCLPSRPITSRVTRPTPITRPTSHQLLSTVWQNPSKLPTYRVAALGYQTHAGPSCSPCMYVCLCTCGEPCVPQWLLCWLAGWLRSLCSVRSGCRAAASSHRLRTV